MNSAKTHDYALGSTQTHKRAYVHIDVAKYRSISLCDFYSSGIISIDEARRSNISCARERQINLAPREKSANTFFSSQSLYNTSALCTRRRRSRRRRSRSRSSRRRRPPPRGTSVLRTRLMSSRVKKKKKK